MIKGMVLQKITPLVKCVVLFLFIFTAKVLTSRPQEHQETRNGIQVARPLHYVRTFTKYHHRRPIQRNNQDPSYSPATSDNAKYMGKRSVDEEKNYVNDEFYNWPAETKILNKRNVDVSQFLDVQKSNVDISNSNERISGELQEVKFSESVRENIVAFEKKVISSGKHNGVKNGVPNELKRYKVKAAVIVTEAPTTLGPTISCLYKIHSISRSVTPSYADDRNAQIFVENDSFAAGPVSDMTLPSGELVQVEKCQSTRAACYTLWHQDQQGNITVFGQGCWRSSQTESRGQCYGCMRVNGLPITNFCCCSTSYCNADFSSLKDVPIASLSEESVTMKAESSMNAYQSSYPNMIASGLVVVVGAVVMAALVRKLYCQRVPNDKDVEETPEDKGDVMGTGPDALATGLLCVDNLKLIEHIGQGKFGSVWRGTLGATPVAVKLYSNSGTWQKEAAIYALPHLAHPNILRYYGSDTRPVLTGGYGRSHLIVVELCAESLRRRLERAPLCWAQLATLAHGLAAALAHLHTPTGSKPCVVHRDVNSNNVLVSSNGEARLADLGLAQAVLPRGDPAPSRITEAGTLRYLAPEALEGALDLGGARAALCALDVFALGLVLWEMLWRTAGAHPAAPPPYAPPYHHLRLPARPTLAQMQSLVSRNKARPPLPKGPVAEARALKLVTDTCDECWDHDAEARLTAVCVEERMSELKQMVVAHAPLIHDNNLHPAHSAETNVPSPSDSDKKSNVTALQSCDVTTPLLYPYPHIGRNACIERNTNTHQHTVELVHKSLKDITTPPDTPRVPNIEANCLSVARTNHTRSTIQDNSLNEIRSYQRPLEYVQNDVSGHDDRGPKQTNLLQDTKVEKPRWGIRKLLGKLNRNKLDTEVKLVPETQSGRTQISVVNEKHCNLKFDRPANLLLAQERYAFEDPCTLSPPNKTLSPTMMADKVFKELPNRDAENPNQIFAVIVPKARADVTLEMRSKTLRGSSESVNKQSVRTSMSSQSIFKSGNSESEDSTVKKRLSYDNRIIANSNSGRSSRASVNFELQYIDNQDSYGAVSPFDVNSDCSSSEDEHLMLLSENGGSKITMQTIPKLENDRRRFQKEVLKEASQAKSDFGFNKNLNKYSNFDNEFSDPNDKENLLNGYSGDNPVYLATFNGAGDTPEVKYLGPEKGEGSPRSPKPALKSLAIKRQRSLEQVSQIFSSSGDVNLLNPAGRVKTPGDLPVAIRRARRDKALQKGKASEGNRLSLYDDRMMFGNSL